MLIVHVYTSLYDNENMRDIVVYCGDEHVCFRWSSDLETVMQENDDDYISSGWQTVFMGVAVNWLVVDQ